MILRLLRGRDRDRGSASIELAIVAPGILAMLAVAIIAGRSNLAQQSVDAAAFDAARTASLALTAGTALQRLRLAAATSTLSSLGVSCRNITVTVNTDGFARPVGQPATVTATVTCRADFSDVALPGCPAANG